MLSCLAFLHLRYDTQQRRPCHTYSLWIAPKSVLINMIAEPSRNVLRWFLLTLSRPYCMQNPKQGNAAIQEAVDAEAHARPEWAALLADSRPDQRPRPRPARDRQSDHRSSRTGIRRARSQSAGGHKADLQDQGPGGDLPGLGHRRLGSGAGQHA